MRVIGLALLLGCGSLVVESAAEASGDTSGEEGSSGDPTTSDDSGGATVFDEGSGGPTGFCGDGVLDDGEACDDGNDLDADGCSHLCELSGSVSWQVELLPERGFGMGLDVRVGAAYVLVEDYGNSVDVQAITSRVSTAGQVVASYAHEDGLADPDVARDAIAVLPDGNVVVGYPFPEGALARIDLDAGPTWTDAIDGWPFSWSTGWGAGEVYTIRSQFDGTFVLFRFTDAGELLDMLFLPATDTSAPLLVGGMFVEQAVPIVLTWTEGVPLRMVSLFGDLLVEDVTTSLTPPRAFAHGAEIAIWTETERIMIDMIGHIQPAQPRTVGGDVLTSFPGGFVIQTEQHFDVYDDAGTLRWSHDSPLMPRLAMPDGIGGLFVLSDPQVEPGAVVLERLAL